MRVPRVARRAVRGRSGSPDVARASAAESERALGLLEGGEALLSHLAGHVHVEHQLVVLGTEAHPEAGFLCAPAQWWFGWTGKREDVLRDFVQPIDVPDDAFTGGDITLGYRVATTSAEDLLITSTTGSIIDGGDSPPDVIAPNARLILTAVGGIGNRDTLELSVKELEIFNTGGGDVNLYIESDVEIVGIAQTGDGEIRIVVDGVLNLSRVKLRDQQRLAAGPLKEYSQFGEGIPFGEATPRAGNDSGGG